MPELPEVETVVNSLKKNVIGLRVKELTCNLDRIYEGKISFNKLTNKLKGKSIKDVTRRGKYILFSFKNSEIVLIIHLGMSGQLMYGSQVYDTRRGKNSLSSTQKNQSTMVIDRHCHFTVTFAKKIMLVFRDIRTFGKVIQTHKDQLNHHPRLKKLGLEPLENNPKMLLEQWPFQSTRKIKSVLLDQSIWAGIGNIYADEALFLAKFRPDRQVNTLKREGVKVLAKKVQQVLKKGIKHSGTTFSNFIHPDGNSGGNYQYLKVYGRKGSACVSCGTTLIRIIVSQRSSVICTNCQQ